MNIRNQRSIKQEDLLRIFTPSLTQRRINFLKYFLVTFAIISILYGLLKWGLTERLQVGGTSMFPALSDKQEIKIEKFVSSFTGYKRGDIVVAFDGEQYIVKRVVGLPKEKLVITNKKVNIHNNQYPNGTTLEESYIGQDANLNPYPTCKIPDCTLEYEDINIPDNSYYLMGDNRIDSSDSREYGPFRKSLIIGKVLDQREVEFNISVY
jgi:signal peptidase I